MSEFNHVSSVWLPPLLLLAAAGFGAAGCGADPASDGGGGDGSGAGAPFTAGDGYPELTESPAIDSPSAAKGTEIGVTIHYDADTRYVRLAIEDFALSTLLVQNWAEAVDAGGGAVHATVSIPSTTTPTDTYYFTFDLCSSDACYDPFKRTTYERTGEGATYTRVGYDSPPLAQSDGPRDSGIAIPTFAIE